MAESVPRSVGVQAPRGNYTKVLSASVVWKAQATDWPDSAGVVPSEGVERLEGRCMPEHVHLCLSIPPKYSVAHTLGFLKGKSAVRIHRELLQERRMTGLPFLGHGVLREYGRLG